jgi:hypothetical protein
MAGSDQLASVAALRTSVEHDDSPPAGTKGPLAALWHAGKGDHERASEMLRSDVSKEASWVRAHLHRRRGEDDEAAKWYDTAGKQPSADPLDIEWGQIAAGLLLHE